MNNSIRTALTVSLLTTLAPLAANAAPSALSTGMFVSGAHATSGTATIYKLDDGSRIVRLTNFTTSNGPKSPATTSKTPNRSTSAISKATRAIRIT